MRSREVLPREEIAAETNSAQSSDLNNGHRQAGNKRSLGGLQARSSPLAGRTVNELSSEKPTAANSARDHAEFARLQARRPGTWDGVK